MNYPFSEGPPGPLYTIIHSRFSDNAMHKDNLDRREKLLVECIAEIAKVANFGFALHRRGQVHGDNGGAAISDALWIIYQYSLPIVKARGGAKWLTLLRSSL